MSDKMIEKLKALYEKAGMGEKFNSDLDKGVVAKIDISKDVFPYSKYAQLSTSISIINSHKYQYFIFKPGYYYKNKELHYDGKNQNLNPNNNLSK